MTHERSPPLDWAWDGSAMEAASGDQHVVAAFGDGTLLALIDGLGHGPEAAAAAQAAAEQLEADPGAPLPTLLQRCDAALRRTRGAAMTLVAIDHRIAHLSWAGIGNVEATLLRADTHAHADLALVLRGGVVGYLMPEPRMAGADLFPGDTLVLATDGIRSGFTTALPRHAEPADLAHAILMHHGKSTDDARVLVARWQGLS